MTLRTHLTRILLIAVLLLGGAGFVTLFLTAREAVVEQFDRTLYAKTLAIELALTRHGAGLADMDHFFRGFDDRRPRDFFELWNPNGRVLGRSESLGTSDLSRSQAAAERETPRARDTLLPTSRPGRVMTVIFEPTPNSPVVLSVASDAVGLREDLGRFALTATGSAAILLLATMLLVPRVLRRGLAPVVRLGEEAAAIDAASLGKRFSTDGLPGELQPIAGRLNDLLGRIELSFERERRFSADLAHELRTPLAELRSAAECALKWPESREAGADRETLAVATQMEGLVKHMLALARSEQGQLEVVRERIALDQLVRDRWERLHSDLLPDSPVVVVELQALNCLGDPTLARAIVDNLLENALEYVARPGTISIVVDSAGLVVENFAPDLTLDDIPRLFERFWRKEAARAGAGRHVGLGLALARSFAEAMGWSLEAQLDGRILVMRLNVDVV